MKTITFILIVLTFFGCKKDKLKGEKSILIGTWKWIKSEYEQDICYPPSFTEIVTPQTENVSYTLTFFEKGKLDVYKNDKLLENGRVVFSFWKSTIYSASEYDFNILLNDKETKKIYGIVSNDTLILGRSYFFQNSESCYTESGNWCCSYRSYYVRQ